MATLLATLPIFIAEAWHARIVQQALWIDFSWRSVYYRAQESTAGEVVSYLCNLRHGKGMDMAGNPIPDALRSDHLFILVGTNPLPDWVATRLLLREGGHLYLVHSNTVLPVARRLARYLTQTHGYPQPQYIAVDSPFKANAVFSVVQKHLGSVRSGTVGLNYTGGTKVMATHGYRAVERKYPAGGPPPVFSYLEAPRSVIHFDPSPDFPNGYESNVGLAGDVTLTLAELFNLHENYVVNAPLSGVLAAPVSAMLARVYSQWPGQQAWQANCSKMELRYPRGQQAARRGPKPGDIKTDADLRPIKLKLDDQFRQIANALTPNGSAGNTTLGEMADTKQWSFTSAREIAEWLEAKWLEHYVLQQFVERHEEYCVHDFGRNIEPRLLKTSSDARKLEEVKFEADVGAMRGYQLHLISCYAGGVKADCKQKLFEVFTRVRQLGGDESRAALVCCFDDPRVIEREVGQVWDIQDRVKVFGRPDLLKLGDRLRDWFATGAQ